MFGNETLRLHPTRIMWGPLLLLIIMVFAAEVGLRSPSVQAKLPPSTWSVSVQYPELDIKMAYLEQHRGQPIDCFFLGSSMMDADVTPTIFEETFRLETGAQFNCFNLGFTGMMAETSAALAEAVAIHYAPRLIVFGTSAVEYRSGNRLVRPVGEEPWVQYLMKKNSLQGWLIEHSIVYRYLLLLPKLRSPEYWMEMHKFQRQIQPDGSQVRTENALPDAPEQTLALNNYSINAADLAGLRRIISLREKGVQVVVVEMPVHPAFLPFYVSGEPGGYEESFAQPVQSFLQARDMDWVRSQADFSTRLPDMNWYNATHLNREGNRIFSVWLAERLAQQRSLWEGNDPKP